MLLVHVVDQLAAHARLNDAIGKGHAVVAVTVGALVSAATRLAAHVDAREACVVPRLLRLWQQAHVVLDDLLQRGNVNGAIGEGLPGFGGLRPLFGRGDEDLHALLANEVSYSLHLHHVLLGDVVVAGVRGVLLAVSRQALGDADAGAVELTDDPLLILGICALGGGVDEVGGPPQRDRFLTKPQSWHDLRQVVVQEVLGQVRELLLLGPVVGVDRSRSTNRTDAAFLGLLVDDPHERVAHHVVAELSFHDAGAEALVHKLAASLLAALQILSDALGGPSATLAGAATHAELDELSNSVLLRVVVVGLHEIQDLVICAGALAVRLAVVARFQLDDPNALSGGPAILLDDARLESHGLLETCSEVRGVVVGKGVLKPNLQIRNLAERILRTHELHDIRGWPDLDVQLAQRTHAIVEFALVSSIGLDLTRVAPHDDCIEGLAHVEEGVVLLVDVMD